MSEVLRFPAPLRRFVAVQMVRPGKWRAAVFIGWHIDPNFRPSRCKETYAEAVAIARRGAVKFGLSFVADRYSVARYGVWSAPECDSAA